MNKFFSLYKNEMKRVIQRPAMWIGLIIAAVLTATMAKVSWEGIMTNTLQASDKEYFGSLSGRISLEKAREKTELQALAAAEDQLPGAEADYLAALKTSETDSSREASEKLETARIAYVNLLNDASNSFENIARSRAAVAVINFKIKYELLQNDYRSVYIDSMLGTFEIEHQLIRQMDLEGAKARYDSVKEGSASTLETFKTLLASLEPAVKENDFVYFLRELIRLEEENDPSPLRDARLSGYALALSACPEKIDPAAGGEILRKVREYASLKVELDEHTDQNFRGIDSYTVPGLTASVNLLTADLTNNISAERAVRTVRFNKDLPAEDEGNDPNKIVASSIGIAGMVAVLLTVLVIAGGSVASEIKNGSIKSLIIAPVRRDKIFFSKVLMLLTVTLFMSLAVSCVGLLFGSAITTWDHGNVIFNAADGSAVIMPFVVAVLLSALIDAFGIFFFAMLALLLSALTRNAIASVIAPAGYFIAKLITDLRGG
ncbi:MAG: ABC transporter permease, partial [Clostridia bacterium]|nr:ABC transporter permease [Clostridia bacterium]